ncbi:hypothetical protein ACJ5NV_09940 [Loktanella agnita]
MKQNRKHRAVAGVIAPPPRPTPLGAALVATCVTLPLCLIWLAVQLI